jgi:hypothetical protein
MMNRNSFAPLRPMVLVFVIVNAIFILGRNKLTSFGIEQNVVIAGNLILFLVSLTSFVLTRKSLGSTNPNAFVRAMYGSFMIKFFVCAIAAFIYIMATKKNVNKPGLIACMGLYIVYTTMEVAALSKILKQKKNA